MISNKVNYKKTSGKYISTNKSKFNSLPKSRALIDEYSGDGKKTKFYKFKKKCRQKAMVIVAIITFGLIIISIATQILVVGGMFSKSKYLEPWDRNSYLNFSYDKRLQILAHAVLSPSVLNLQPWKVELSETNENEFFVYAKPERIWLKADPNGQEFFISIGAFLEYIDTCGQPLGLDIEIEMFPNGEIDKENLISSLGKNAIAKVVVDDGILKHNDLFLHVYEPSTNRSEYKTTTIGQTAINEMQSIKKYESTIFEFYRDKDTINKIANYSNMSKVLELSDSQVIDSRQNLFRVNESQKNRLPYGLSFNSVNDRKFMQWLKQGIVTLFPQVMSNEDFKENDYKKANMVLNSMPMVGLIKSKDNSIISQVHAGRDYARLTLIAKHIGIAMQPISSAILDFESVKDVKEMINSEFCEGDEEIQMILRMGYPKTKPVIDMRESVKQILFTK